MKRILIVLLISVVYRTYSFGQMFFSPGYAVTQTRDTLRGEIKTKDNSTFVFRSNTVPERDYSPEQVVFYQTEGIHVVSVDWLEGVRTTRRFMREVVTGRISLFSLAKPEERLTCAIRLPDQTYVPLKGNLALLRLTQIMSDCNDTRLKQLLTIGSFVNNQGYFERVVQAYNICMSGGAPQPVSRLKQPFHYEVGLLAGVGLNSWYYGANQARLSPYWNPNGAFSSITTGVFGGFLTIASQKRLSLTTEVFYSYYKGERTVKVNNPLDSADPASRQYSFQEQYLALPITGRYVFSTRPIRWYVKGGVCISYALHIEGNYLANSNNQLINVPIKAGIGVGYLIGLGAEVPVSHKNKLFVEVRTTPHIVMDGVTRMASSRSLQLTVGVPLIMH